MKLTFNKKALAVATAGLLGIGIAGSAQANVLATSLLDQYDLLFKNNATGNVLDRNTDLGFLTFTSTGDVSAALTGYTTVTDTGTNPPGPVDLPPVCVGTGCNPIAPNNTFPVLTGPASGIYSAADQNESGSPIVNVPDGSGGVLPTPAVAANAAYVGLEDGSKIGSSTANNNLNSSVIFSVLNPIQVLVEFSARAYLEAFVSGDQQFPAFATAAYNQDFVIDDLTNGVRVFSWAPDGVAGGIIGGTELTDPFTLNSTVSLNAPLPFDVKSTGGIHTLGVASVGFFSALTPFLTPGTLYQISARNTTEADARNIPEPTTLALMGLGLLGFGFSRRGRRAS